MKLKDRVVARSLAANFKTEAARFERLGEDDAGALATGMDRCGRLLVEAWRAGLLDLKIAPLVAWLEGKAPHPTNPAAEGGPCAANARAVYVRCYANLWHMVLGDHEARLMATPEGWEVSAFVSGGLMPPRRPHRPALPSTGWTLRVSACHYSDWCEWLAELIGAAAEAEATARADKRKHGRRFTDSELMDAIISVRRDGSLDASAVAGRLGCSPRTVMRRLARNPDLSVALYRDLGRARRQSEVS